MSLIDDVKRDREAGTDGPWAAFSGSDTHTNIVAVVPRTECVFSLPGHYKDDPNVRRITRVPDLEAALLAADELVVASKGLRNWDGTPTADIKSRYDAALSTYRNAVEGKW